MSINECTIMNRKLMLTVVLMSVIFLVQVQDIPATSHHRQSVQSKSNVKIQEKGRCIFDDIQKHQNVGRTIINYQMDDVKVKSKRSAEGIVIDVYEPIRITTFVQNEEHLMDSVQVEKLEAIMAGAESVVQKLLAVFPVQGPLLMDRSEAACRTTYNGGQNDGKCAEISPTYREECLDNFEIPADHLEGLWTWDASNPEPAITHYEEGAGIPNTDVVLYVKAEHTTQCNSGDVFAYASYCKQDQFNRPIAGVINFCPDPLLSEDFDLDKFTLLALHEAFHVLGFSKNLFDQFQDCQVCDEGLQCETRDDVIRVDASGQSRLDTPAVVAAGQIHFGCTDQEQTGVPLENLDKEGSYSSHWETRYMFGSVMAPAILQAHSTFLDNMTLAVFEDSGWYKVNYDLTGDFPWGKDQGCHFGSAEFCQTNFTQFFCNESMSGCDYVGLNKATCETNTYLDGCMLYWPDSDTQCVMSSDDANLNMTGEMTGPSSRCFMSNAILEGTCTPEDLEGRCYATRCSNSSDLYEILLQDSDWIACPAETSIQVPGYDGEVYCPPVDVICRNHSSLLNLIDPPCLTCTTPPSSTSAIPTTQTSQGEVEVELNFSLEFNDLEYSEVDEGSEVENFKGVLRERISETVQLPQDSIEILDIRPGSVKAIVCITHDQSSQVSLEDAYNSLSAAVTSGEFSIEYNNSNYSASAVSLILSSTQAPHTTSTAIPPTVRTSPISPLTIVMLSIIALLFVSTFLAICVWKNKKTATTIAPTPRATTREGAPPGEAYIIRRGERAKTDKTESSESR